MKLRGFPILCIGLIPSGLMAAGYYLPNQDAYATAKGNAFVATADTAAAVHYNPAGMTQLDRAEVQVGVYGIVLGNDARVMGENFETDTEFQAVPHIYYVQPYNDRLAFGFGLNSPFGLGNDWGRDNTTLSQASTESRLLYASATTAVAYKVNDCLSLGASFSLNYADLTLERGLGLLGSYLRFEGDDIGYSGTLSAHWQPHEKHAFGLIYSTKSTFDLEGKASSDFLDDHSGELDFMTPARVAAGYSYRPAPGWNIEANIEWLNWDELNTLTLKSETVGGTQPITFDWKSSFIYEVGVSYTTETGYVFAAGYDFNESSEPDKNFTPAVSDADRHWFNVGVGRRMEASSWMLAYQFGYSNRTVENADNPFANGRYESRHNALVFSWNQKF